MRTNMQPADIFKELIKNVALLLKEHKYKRYGGNVFYTAQQCNWGFIGFQKSQSSTRHEIRFTINLGICSKVLMNFYDPEKTPSIYECHWNYRIGHLIPAYRNDKWWFINEQTIAEQLIQEIKDNLVNIAIPEIEHNISDEQLQSIWLSGKCTGISDAHRLMNLSVLLKKSGMNSQLKLVLKELQHYVEKQSSASFMVKQHLLQLKLEN